MIIVQLTPEQLQEMFQSTVNLELTKLKQPTQDKLLTRKEAARFLDVSLPTLGAWEKSKKIQSLRIASRVYFKQSELLK
jgi:DNA-binding XRE family transcriptional regulator